MPTRPVLPSLVHQWQRRSRGDRLLACAVLLVLLSAAGYSLLALIPRDHALTISGTDITSNRHFLAKALQEAAA